MISWILTASYLWKDTWKRWLEQPGSILARSVVTIIMVSLSVLLLIGFRMQIERLRTEVEKFGLDNLLIAETVTPMDIADGIPADRFRSIDKWGKLFTARRMIASAKCSNGRNATVVAYTDNDIRGLFPYLKNGHDVFLLTYIDKPGLVVDCDIQGVNFTGITLKPEENISQLVQNDTLFVPLSYIPEIEKRGYAMIYYLERDHDAPEIETLTTAIHRVIKADGNGKVEIKSAAKIKKKLNKLENQQSSMRIWLAAILGGALALIYGVLSILEFRQSMYVSALLKSFGVSRIMLGIRSVFENVIIVNCVTFAVIFMLSKYHEVIFKSLKIKSSTDINALYWGEESLWTIAAANLGVLISSIPVFWALRKQVGDILE